MNLSKNKVAAGVIGLIAVVGIANTQAIISLTNYVKGGNDKVAFSGEGQEAQVSLASSRCVEMLPVNGTETSIDYPGATLDVNGGIADNWHHFHINFKIKNRCSSNIYVFGDLGQVIPGFYPDPGSVFPGEIQEYNPWFSYNEPSPIVPATDIGVHHGSIWGFESSLFGSNYSFVDIEIPASNLSNISILENFGSSINGYLVPPNSERFFSFSSAVGIDNQTFPDGYSKAYRMKLKKIRWFTQSSYSDSILSSNDLRTYIVPESLSKSITTSYVSFWKNPLIIPEVKIQVSKDIPTFVGESLTKTTELYNKIQKQNIDPIKINSR